jgi:hypothetical protein
MTFDGIITFIGEEVEVGQNNVPKITFVLEENVDKEFKSSIAVDILGDKTSLIKEHKVGDAIKVSLNFKANEYEGRRYNRISAWRIEGTTAAATEGNADAPKDDLPF